MSLRARLLAGMASIAVVLIVVSVVLTVTTRSQLMDQADSRLESFSPFRGGGAQFPQFPDDLLPPPVVDQRTSDVYQGWVDSAGTLHDRFLPNAGDGDVGAPDLAGIEPLDGDSRLFTVDAVDGDETYRVLAERFGDRVEITAVLIDDVEETISDLIVLEIAGAVLILAALGLVSWWVVRLGIRPVQEMTATATRIAAGDLSERVAEVGAPGTEPRALAHALNQMLGQIESALDERAASEDRLRRFVADASHELRTPVTTIRGYAELYRHGGLSNDAALTDAMRRTEQEAARMGRLVDDMLTLAKLDEQRPLDRRPVDLVRLAADAAADARAAAPGREVRLDIPDTPVVIDGDDDRLRQVIANLVANALVHTAAGVPIGIRVRSADATAVIEVEDAGSGMPAEVVERATERFFRADPSRARHRGGSGLGLSIVDAAVAAHGGQVTIDSEPGRGTAVRLSFPVGA